jgi:hypothetical protein
MKPDGIGGIHDIRGARRRRDPCRLLSDQPRRAAVDDADAGRTPHQPQLPSWKEGSASRSKVLKGVLALIRAVVWRAGVPQ